MQKTPFEIFRERATVERTENPIYRKVWKVRPSRSFIPVSDSWWSKYGFTWELEAVEVTFKASVPNNSWREAVLPEKSFATYLHAAAPSMAAVSYEVITYEFQPVAWLQILDSFQFKHQLAFDFSGMWVEFWRQAERLINEKTKVTTNSR